MHGFAPPSCGFIAVCTARDRGCCLKSDFVYHLAASVAVRGSECEAGIVVARFLAFVSMGPSASARLARRCAVLRLTGNCSIVATLVTPSSTMSRTARHQAMRSTGACCAGERNRGVAARRRGKLPIQSRSIRRRPGLLGLTFVAKETAEDHVVWPFFVVVGERKQRGVLLLGKELDRRLARAGEGR